MDLSKLKIDDYNDIQANNFPEGVMPKLESNNPQVIIYYIDKIEDVEAFIKYVQETRLPEDNRVIMVYKKGRKDGINRDTVIKPFKDKIADGFKIRRPALCSLSKEYSAFVQSYEK